jgi:hypothetical protein
LFERFKHAIASIAEQPSAQAGPSPMQPGHHGPQRGLHNCGGLAVAKAFNINEVEDLTKFFRQILEPCDQAVGRNLSEHGVFGRYRGRVEAKSLANGQLLDRWNAQQRLALSFPVTIYESVQQDAVQPGSDIRVRGEAVKRGASPHDGFLNEIFGILTVLGQLQRGPQQLGLVRQRIALEPFRKLRTHPHLALPAHLFAPPVRPTSHLPSITQVKPSLVQPVN